METIHQGIAFSYKMPLTKMTQRIDTSQVLYAVLRSPSTQNAISADVVVLGDYVENEDQTAIYPTTITISFNTTTTATMDIGAYTLEIYANDKKTMFYYQRDFAFVEHSSASGTTPPTDVDIEQDVTADSDLTEADIDNYLQTLN